MLIIRGVIFFFNCKKPWGIIRAYFFFSSCIRAYQVVEALYSMSLSSFCKRSCLKEFWLCLMMQKEMSLQQQIPCLGHLWSFSVLGWIFYGNLFLQCELVFIVQKLGAVNTLSILLLCSNNLYLLYHVLTQFMFWLYLLSNGGVCAALFVCKFQFLALCSLSNVFFVAVLFNQNFLISLLLLLF